MTKGSELSSLLAHKKLSLVCRRVHRNIEWLSTYKHGSRLAGADIKEMKDLGFSEAYSTDFIADWARVTKIKKPIIAAVSGFAVCPLTSLVSNRAFNKIIGNPARRWL